MKKIIAFFLFVSVCFIANAQLTFADKKFTYADTLRGSNTPERAWWDVLRYDITVKPDYASKTIEGKTTITFKKNFDENDENDRINRIRYLSDARSLKMQIDLQQPLVIDSIIGFELLADTIYRNPNKLNYPPNNNETTKHIKRTFKTNGNVTLIDVPTRNWWWNQDSITIYYHGKPREAVNPPWDGGWVWTKDSLGRPWMSVACQGLGASVWYPCKDIQSDEPDNGASLSVIIPDSLVAVSNGRLQSKQNNNDGTSTYKWAVVNPINNYDITTYIGKYVNFGETYKGEKGNLDVNYWVLDYNLARAKSHIQPDVERMLKAFEYWMGPYPFYEDGYKIVDAPYLGMEHQSAIAYGNKYREGYLGKDRSLMGWGLKWDFIVVHESGHEWFGNNITSKDIADMWIHEGFTTYSETLFTEYYYGKKAGAEYNAGQRHNIRNDEPVIGHYGVNDEGSSDEYDKASNMINIIRNSMDDDEKFRAILRGLNKTFYHQTVTTAQVEGYVSKHAGIDYSKLFDQYLRTTQIPVFEFYFDANKKQVSYRWSNCVAGFNIPLVLKNDDAKIKIHPTESWKNIDISPDQIALFNPILIESMYYIKVQEKNGQ